MKVLIVEDTEIHTTLMLFMLKKLKKGQIFSAKDAFEGYAILKAIDDIDVVIMDYRLPYVSGIEFIKKLRDTAAFKDLPVIISTADEDISKLTSLGANRILGKPYVQDALLAAIEEVVSAKSKTAA